MGLPLQGGLHPSGVSSLGQLDLTGADVLRRWVTEGQLGDVSTQKVWHKVLQDHKVA